MLAKKKVTTLREAFEAFSYFMEFKKYSLNKQEVFLKLLNKLINFLGPEFEINNFTEETLISFIKTISLNQGTMYNISLQINEFLNFLSENKYLNIHIELKFKYASKGKEMALNDKIFDKFIKLIQNERDKILVILSGTSGIFVKEFICLQKKDIDLDTKTIISGNKRGFIVEKYHNVIKDYLSKLDDTHYLIPTTSPKDEIIQQPLKYTRACSIVKEAIIKYDLSISKVDFTHKDLQYFALKNLKKQYSILEIAERLQIKSLDYLNKIQ